MRKRLLPVVLCTLRTLAMLAQRVPRRSCHAKRPATRSRGLGILASRAATYHGLPA
jgi:hypothetical protein